MTQKQASKRRSVMKKLSAAVLALVAIPAKMVSANDEQIGTADHDHEHSLYVEAVDGDGSVTVVFQDAFTDYTTYKFDGLEDYVRYTSTNPEVHCEVFDNEWSEGYDALEFDSAGDGSELSVNAQNGDNIKVILDGKQLV